MQSLSDNVLGCMYFSILHGLLVEGVVQPYFKFCTGYPVYAGWFVRVRTVSQHIGQGTRIAVCHAFLGYDVP